MDKGNAYCGSTRRAAHHDSVSLPEMIGAGVTEKFRSGKHCKKEPSTMDEEDDGWKASIAPSIDTKPFPTRIKPKKEKNVSAKSKRDTAIQGSRGRFLQGS